ncbi:FAD-binding oxidoreductase [Micromonospora sp. NPDC049559]|uniref:FAD-binding oxidoreductase n=1 Tax=Micromonospora sp. NPDC049559 TaxID=3155923 RepID=UPI00343237DE
MTSTSAYRPSQPGARPGAGLRRAVRRLRPILGDRLLEPGDAAYAAATRLWNSAVTRRPALVARCRTTAEVRAAVVAARDFRLPLSVRGGGHDWAGRALADGGLVVDLTGLRSVEIDVGRRTAVVGGGATVADLLAAARPYGLVTPTGVVRAVGLAGLTLAGGYGPLNGRYGLALDNLLGAEVVLADGRRVVAAPDADAELFWALRGGGGNFGVVTGLRYRLHALPTVLAGMIMFPLAQAGPVLRGYHEFLAAAPDELTVMAGFLPGPDGGPLLFLAPTWSGADLAAGEREIARLAAPGTPSLHQVGPMAYDDALRLFDASMVDGNRYLLRTRWLAGVPEPVARVLTEAARRSGSAYSTLALHHFHGAAARVARPDTAFGLRDPHLVAEIIAVWAPGQEERPYREWAERVAAELEPLALPGGYPNLLAPDETDRLRAAYGPNYPRLLAAKRRYDPAGVFGSATPTLPRPDHA